MFEMNSYKAVFAIKSFAENFHLRYNKPIRFGVMGIMKKTKLPLLVWK